MRLPSALREQAMEMLRLLQKAGERLDAVQDAKVREVIGLAFEGAEADEWDQVAELYRDVSGLSDEEARARLSGRGEALSRPEPKPVEELVREGWFAKYLEWAQEHEAPAQFHFGAALTACAAGLGRQPLLDWGGDPTYPNLYTLLLGPSGARKSSAISRAVRLVGYGLESNVLPVEGSHQGFALALSARQTATGLWADGFIVSRELSVLLRKDKYKEAMVQWLTDWFDCPDEWDRAIVAGGPVLHNVCVSLLGASNLPWLRTLPEESTTGGFLPRHLLFEAEGRRHRKAFPRFSEKLGAELVASLQKCAGTIPETITFDQDALRYVEHWYENEMRVEYAAETSERVRYWLDRKQAMVFKVAMVWQLVDGGPRDVLVREWLEKARGAVDLCDASVKSVYGQMGTTKDGEATQAVLSYLQRRGGKATERALIKAMWRPVGTAARVRAALDTLRRAGMLKQTHVLPEGTTWEVLG